MPFNDTAERKFREICIQGKEPSLLGVGLINAELGLRLRYEIAREFAPYIGISYDTKVGQTAAYVAQEGRAPSVLSFVAGARVWF